MIEIRIGSFCDLFSESQFPEVNSIYLWRMRPDSARRVRRIQFVHHLMHDLYNTGSQSGNTLPTETKQIMWSPGDEPVPGCLLEEFIGKGGFAEVWKGRDVFPNYRKDSPLVAMKIMHRQGLRYFKEDRAHFYFSAIYHPNILRYKGGACTPDWSVVYMELADKSLMDRLREVRSEGLPGIPGYELLGYMRGVASGLDALNLGTYTTHELKLSRSEEHFARFVRRVFFTRDNLPIQHCDVKPQNILLVNGQAKLSDFGLFEMFKGSEKRCRTGGTPGYMPPEFFEGRVTRRSDQFSLAVTYCELRGGRHPFRCENGVLGEPDLSKLPPSEQPVVAKALARNHKDRFYNCGRFVTALERAMRRSNLNVEAAS